VNRSPVVSIAVVLIAVTACAAPANPTAAPSSPGPATTSASQAPPTTDQWCASYASLTGVLSASSTPSEAAQGLLALDRFSQLWKLAGSMGLITVDEVAANQRAVDGYRAVISLLASGSASTSLAVSSARQALAKQTDSDHALLASSAAKVLGLCGHASPSASA
jgi:hypothetical protein